MESQIDHKVEYDLGRGNRRIDRFLPIQFNSVYFVQPNIPNYKFASKGFTICTHMTSLSQDLNNGSEKNPK